MRHTSRINTTTTPLISVIIPVYNASKTIQKSIRSCSEQTLKNIEILCIDNNSTDKSAKIVQQLSKKDKRIKLFSEKKQGAGPARNKGLREAAGEFIFFLDPDDSIYGDDTLEKLYNIAKKHKVNIAGGSLLDSLDKKGNRKVNIDEYYFERDSKIKYSDYQFDWGFWRFIYNREFLKKNNLLFPAYLRGQDTVFFVKAMVAADKFYAIKDPVYRYNYKHSTSKHTSKTYEDYEKANLDVIKIANKHGLKQLEATAQGHRKPLVTVIIPIYNVEKYLKDCLDSVISQTYENLEIILVDDKTPDNSGKIADEYARKDPRIKVIHKPENEGLNMARATGFKASAGEYITFVDSDDMITATCVEVAVKALLGYSTDFVRFNLAMFTNREEIKEKIEDAHATEDIVLQDKRALYRTQFKGLDHISHLMCVWGGVYSRDVVKKIDWKKSNFRAYEDNFWTLEMLNHAKSGAYIGSVGYLYRWDDSPRDSLGVSIVENNLNGKPVGYLQFLDMHIKAFRYYNKKYKIQSEDLIDEFAMKQWSYRLKQLIDRNALCLENNLDYVQEAVKWVFAYNEHLKSQNEYTQYHIIKLTEEIDSFLGLKRSGRLFLGNIKRKIKNYLANMAN